MRGPYITTTRKGNTTTHLTLWGAMEELEISKYLITTTKIYIDET